MLRIRPSTLLDQYFLFLDAHVPGWRFRVDTPGLRESMITFLEGDDPRVVAAWRVEAVTRMLIGIRDREADTLRFLKALAEDQALRATIERLAPLFDRLVCLQLEAALLREIRLDAIGCLFEALDPLLRRRLKQMKLSLEKNEEREAIRRRQIPEEAWVPDTRHPLPEHVAEAVDLAEHVFKRMEEVLSAPALRGVALQLVDRSCATGSAAASRCGIGDSTLFDARQRVRAIVEEETGDADPELAREFFKALHIKLETVAS